MAAFIIPWGRLGDVPNHIEKELASEVESGLGAAERFWRCREKETVAYAGGQEFGLP